MDVKEKIKHQLLQELDGLVLAKDITSVEKSAKKIKIALAVLENPLQRGDRGETVRIIQDALKHQGFDPGPIDGHFGAETEEAVKELQQKKGLPADGIVEYETLAVLWP